MDCQTIKREQIVSMNQHYRRFHWITIWNVRKSWALKTLNSGLVHLTFTWIRKDMKRFSQSEKSYRIII